MRSYKIRAYPTGAQIRRLNHWFGAARWVWNWGLESRTKAYTRRKQSVSSIDIGKRLTELKKLERFSWLADCPTTCFTKCLRDQDSAFANFFRRVKTGGTPGYPKFKRRGERDRLRFADVSMPGWIYGKCKLPKIGIIKLAEKLPAAYPKMVTLKRDPDGKYFVSFCVEVEIDLLPVVSRTVGVDLGLTHLATMSTGEKIENPRKLANRLRYLKQQQHALARRMKGSKRREKQRLKVARAHAKVREQRQYAAHQLTTKLVRENQIICIEDLAVKNMIQHPRLSRYIADAGWGEIRRQLEYKCRWYGRTLIVLDRFFPSSKTCSKCEHKLDELRLDVREWTCPKCGAIHDRDINAAQNLLAAGMRQLGGRESRDLLVDGAAVNAPVEARTDVAI